MPLTRLSPPSISGSRRVSPLYQTMGIGQTNSVLLIGHADAERMETPFQVQNMKTGLNFLGADLGSPLVRALLESYNAGCRDIYVYAAAPMDEYEDNPGLRYTTQLEFGGLTFYEKWYQRLATAYSILKMYDSFEFTVPIEAPFYDSGSSDFLTQLANYCNDSFAINGSVTLGVLGTRVPNKTVPDQKITNYNQTTINAMVDDPRILALGSKGKFVSVFVGEGIFMPEQHNAAYNRSFEAAIASLLSTIPLDRGMAGKLVPGVASTTSPSFTKEQLEIMASGKLNPVTKTAAGRRGFSFQSKIVTDNTVGEDKTDYWSLHQMRTVATVVNKVRQLGLAYIGESYEEFRKAVYDFMKDLEVKHYIQQSSTSILRDPEDPYRALVEIAIKPNIGIRHIVFSVEVGPGV